jgi:hypothetical protein
MNDIQGELHGLLAKILHRKNETTQADKEIEARANEVFNDQQMNIEKFRTKAMHGDPKAQAAYMSLLRGRKVLPRNPG